MNEAIQKILSADHHDPFSYLGVHEASPTGGALTFRTFQPHASTVALLINHETFVMEKCHPEGIFQCTIPHIKTGDDFINPFDYQYIVTFYDGNEITINDPYGFAPQMDETDRYLFNAGTNYRIYDNLGAHLRCINRIDGVLFRVWAPAARAVSVVGNFNGWDGRVHQCRSLGSSGIWELFIPNLKEGEYYRYHIRSQHGDILIKSDPFQFYGELRPNTASIVRNIDNYQWNDHNWQLKKAVNSSYDQPMTIYEVHPGSWQRDPGNSERFLTFHELADYLIPYVKDLGFTHIELMPVMEHPLDESWGYQVTGTYSVTSRYGTPEDFKYFIDRCHQADIGVILDWVPAHFPRDSYSLARFDGSALYEHEDPRKGSHPEWGTHIFNYGRKEVSNYLISNALFWLDKYHIDGLRVDAVASMLYLDYARKDGEWIPNRYGGKENLEAIEFIKHLNSIIYDHYPNALMIAEESTSFYGVSKPADQGGLGFGYKWNMGWMNDILSYFAKDPIHRRYHHNSLTFSIMYAFSENFILPLSHDEVVHGKCSLIEKMPGDEWQKFANLRLLFLAMWMHPGKKLLFMGGEFGQKSEWYCKRSLDWHLIEKGSYHNKLKTFIKVLNKIYHNNPCLYELDFSHEGFKWLDLEDRDNSIICFARYGKDRLDHLICILNFTPQTFSSYTVGLPTGRRYKQLLCSDAKEFGGSDKNEERIIIPLNKPYAQGQYQAQISVAPLAGIILQPID